MFFSLLKKSNLRISAGIANYTVVSNSSSDSSDDEVENNSLVI
jgi:hypothetical protein